VILFIGYVIYQPSALLIDMQDRAETPISPEAEWRRKQRGVLAKPMGNAACAVSQLWC